jgi:hypothetical protein
MEPKSKTVVIAGILSLLIASIGWILLYRRTNKMARRSETFSLISEVISILKEFEMIAEDQLKEFIELSAIVGPNTHSDIKKRMQKVQLIEGKFLVKFNLFRQRLNHLEKRKIFIDSEFLIKIKQAMTSGNIDTTIKYQIVLHSTYDVHHTLYKSFEEIYKPLYFSDYIFDPANEIKILVCSILFLMIPLTPAIIALVL